MKKKIDYCKTEKHLETISMLMTSDTNTTKENEKLQAENSALKLQNVGLVGALQKCRHSEKCSMEVMEREPGGCVCGKDAALASSDPKQEEAVRGVVEALEPFALEGYMPGGPYASHPDYESIASPLVSIRRACKALQTFYSFFPHLKGPKV